MRAVVAFGVAFFGAVARQQELSHTDLNIIKDLASQGNATAHFHFATVLDGGLQGHVRNTPKAVLYDYFAAVGGSQGALMTMGHRHQRRGFHIAAALDNSWLWNTIGLPCVHSTQAESAFLRGAPLP
jgi:hypothetical protein